MTAADRLRLAATRIRETANAATLHGQLDGWYQAADMSVILSVGGSATPTADAAHIASWSPPVALAVADWLDTAGADVWAHGPLHCASGCEGCDDDLWMPHARRALHLADAILGESA